MLYNFYTSKNSVGLQADWNPDGIQSTVLDEPEPKGTHQIIFNALSSHLSNTPPCVPFFPFDTKGSGAPRVMCTFSDDFFRIHFL